jgi:hypothetical protein
VLTMAEYGVSAPSDGRRTAAVLGALHPTARLSQPWIVALTITVASLPLALTLLGSGDDESLPIVLVCLSAGASLGWAVDDPGAELLAALPIGAPFRLRVRLCTAALVASVVLAAVAGMVAAGPGFASDTTDRLPEALGAGSVAVAAGLFAARQGHRLVGPGAVISGLLVTGSVAVLAVRWPDQLPTFMANAAHHRWWWLALAGTAFSAGLGRDPGRR